METNQVSVVLRRGTLEKPAPRIIPIRLDVNDEASLAAAVERIVEEQGHLDAVVCNAGNGIYGPVEGATDAEVRYQFETCFFGSLKTIQSSLTERENPIEEPRHSNRMFSGFKSSGTAVTPGS